VGEATAASLDRTTMQEPIAVTTQNIHTRETLLAGLTVASAKTEKCSRRRISATTVCAWMGKSHAPYWIAPTGILMAGVRLWAEPTLERSVFSRSLLMGSVILTARPPDHMMARPGAPPRWTTRVGTLEEKATGVTAPLEAALLTMEGVGAPGEVGAAARHPVEEERGPGGGLALVEPVLDQRQKVSGASCRVAVTVAPGALGDHVTALAEEEELRAGAVPVGRELVLHRSPARAQPSPALDPKSAQMAPD